MSVIGMGRTWIPHSYYSKTSVKTANVCISCEDRWKIDPVNIVWRKAMSDATCTECECRLWSPSGELLINLGWSDWSVEIADYTSTNRKSTFASVYWWLNCASFHYLGPFQSWIPVKSEFFFLVRHRSTQGA